MINTDERRMYDDLAWLWPLMGQPNEEGWIAEGEEFARTIREHSPSEARTLLHLGCGGGKNDYTFKKYFAVTGVDVSAAMLANARKLNPEIDYVVGDLRAVRLNKTFDAVIIADSIDYMLTADDLRAGKLEIETDRHLGGIFPLPTWVDLLRDVGFEVTLIETPLGAPKFACVKP